MADLRGSGKIPNGPVIFVLYDFITGFRGGVDHLDIYIERITDDMKFLAILWSDNPFHVFANLSSIYCRAANKKLILLMLTYNI